MTATKYQPVQMGKRVPLNDKTQEKEEAIKRAKKLAKKKNKLNPFPVHAFPKHIQNIIHEYHEAYRLPIDYHCTSIITAASMAIGNGYAAYYKRGQVYPPMIWATVVGFPSSGKSPAIDFGVWPLMAIEKKYRIEHTKKLMEWKKEAVAKALNNEAFDHTKPRSKDIIINDATVEAINKALINNPKGLLLYQDEILGWINSMNSYRKGSDREYFLSTWSGKSAKISRTNSETMFIPHPYISVIGGVQPGKLTTLASNDMKSSGFFARILFAYPDDMEKPEESDKQPSNFVFELYQGIINFLHNLPNDFEEPENSLEYTKVNRIEVPLSAGAFASYVDFLNDYTKQMNDTEDEDVKSTLGKLQQYCLRIALILEMLDLACNQAETSEDYVKGFGTVDLKYMNALEIQEDTICKAVEIIQYFKYTGLKVIQRLENPAKSLKRFQQIWYDTLPENFTAKEAIEIGEAITKSNKAAKLAERTIKNLLNNPRLFTKKGRGEYEKNYLT